MLIRISISKKNRNRFSILKCGICIYFLFPFLACNNLNPGRDDDNVLTSKISSLNYKVSSFYPHDTLSFTEGLVFHQNQIFESTGSPEEFPQTESIIGPVTLKTGVINKKIELNKQKYFGEGIVFLKDKLFQLTYKAKTGFIYNAKMFKKIGEFNFKSKEGWGLTTDGTNLIMSDGTDKLSYFDPEILK